MIKKLRLRFILVALISVLVVLFGTIFSINAYNYSKVENTSQKTLSDINDIGVNEWYNDWYTNPDPGGHSWNRNERLLSEHYFLVSFNKSGEVNGRNFNHIMSIREDEGVELAKTIYAKNSKYGSIGNYRYQTRKTEDNTTIAFLDVKEKTDSFNNFLISSVAVSGVSYAVLAVLIVAASMVVFKTSEESYRKQKAFITNASHELKTPLTIISTDLEIVEMDNGKNEWTESIHDQVDRLTRMTNQLVALSKLDENDYKNFPFAIFSLSALAKECVDAFAATFQKREFIFNYDIKENIDMNGNKYLINELLYVLMDNALKYAREKGNITFSVKQNKNKVEIILTNDIEENSDINPDLLFERFYRSSNSSKKEGSGIGLSIAKEIVELHKGKISAIIKDDTISFIVVI